MHRRAVAVVREAEMPSQPASPRARMEQMFEAHHNVVWRTLRRYGLDPEAAADTGQQAFLIAVERVGDIWPGSERAFLIGTALRLARGVQRKASRLQFDAEIDRHAGTGAHAEARTSTLELLDRTLASLDPGLVEVFVLHDVEGFSSPEIAQALDLPLGTVASRLRRAREDFRAAAHRLQLVFKREEGVR
jgi:RNA polymerase sigma-70 factor, ECF subfamily